MYSLQVCMPISDIVVHYIGWGHFPNPKERHCFQWDFVFDLCNIFQVHNTGIQQDLPVYRLLI